MLSRFKTVAFAAFKPDSKPAQTGLRISQNFLRGF